MRSRDRLPSQQEILDGSTPSAELSGPRDIAERAASETAERDGNDSHSTNANFPVSRYTRAPPSVIIRGKTAVYDAKHAEPPLSFLTQCAQFPCRLLHFTEH
jgi:hypothetical protein